MAVANQKRKVDQRIENSFKSIGQQMSDAQTNDDDSKLEKLLGLIGKIVVLNITDIDISQNIRKDPIDEDSAKFKALVESIRKNGLLQNAVVELRLTEKSYQLVCLAGHRRIRALKLLGIEKIPCLLLQNRNSSQSTSAALAENLNRDELHFLDVADGYGELAKQGWSVDAISSHFERNEKTVKRYLKMAEWGDEIKSLIRENSDKLSLRIVLHEFVQKSFDSDEEIFAAIKNRLVERKGASAKPSPRKYVMRTKLTEFYKQRPEINDDMRKILEEALEYLKLI
jgi:ParB/RepB/Spo0J family partition protein